MQSIVLEVHDLNCLACLIEMLKERRYLRSAGRDFNIVSRMSEADIEPLFDCTVYIHIVLRYAFDKASMTNVDGNSGF